MTAVIQTDYRPFLSDGHQKNRPDQDDGRKTCHDNSSEHHSWGQKVLLTPTSLYRKSGAGATPTSSPMRRRKRGCRAHAAAPRYNHFTVIRFGLSLYQADLFQAFCRKLLRLCGKQEAFLLFFLRQGDILQRGQSQIQQIFHQLFLTGSF